MVFYTVRGKLYRRLGRNTDCHAACGTSVVQRGWKSVTRASQSGQGGRIFRARWWWRKLLKSEVTRCDGMAPKALRKAGLYYGTVRLRFAQTITKGILLLHTDGKGSK